MKKLITHVHRHGKRSLAHVKRHKHKYLFSIFGTFALIKMVLLFAGFLGITSSLSTWADDPPSICPDWVFCEDPDANNYGMCTDTCTYNQWTVSITIGDNGGGQGSGGGLYNNGTGVCIEAIADPGHSFLYWDSPSYGGAISENPYCFSIYQDEQFTVYFSYCGDGSTDTEAGETCDDGDSNGIYGGTCNLSCDGPAPFCGDGNHDPEESCDDGVNNGQIGYCNATCDAPTPYCGDNNTDVGIGETCDDGANNGTYGGACNSTCDGPAPFCGDSNTDVGIGETCDDGDSNGIYGGTCNLSCDGPAPYCGDGNHDPEESCDDGGNNGIYGGTCNAICNGPAPFCGDGTPDYPQETCDEGANNGIYGGTCNLSCDGSPSYCGDGIIQGGDGEICDDGLFYGLSGYTCAVTCDGYLGCTDPDADNYDASASENDNSCVYYSYGCAYSEAYNYSPDGLEDLRACLYCGDGIIQSGDGEICDDGYNYGSSGYFCSVSCNGYRGCMDRRADNYDILATENDGSCTYENYTPPATPEVYNIDIIGTLAVGSTITGTYEYEGADPEGDSLYQWERNDQDITGATEISYKLTSEDIHKEITFDVTPVSEEGTQEQSYQMTQNFVEPITKYLWVGETTTYNIPFLLNYTGDSNIIVYIKLPTTGDGTITGYTPSYNQNLGLSIGGSLRGVAPQTTITGFTSGNITVPAYSVYWNLGSKQNISSSLSWPLTVTIPVGTQSGVQFRDVKIVAQGKDSPKIESNPVTFVAKSYPSPILYTYISNTFGDSVYAKTSESYTYSYASNQTIWTKHPFQNRKSLIDNRISTTKYDPNYTGKEDLFNAVQSLDLTSLLSGFQSQQCTGYDDPRDRIEWDNNITKEGNILKKYLGTIPVQKKFGTKLFGDTTCIENTLVFTANFVGCPEPSTFYLSGSTIEGDNGKFSSPMETIKIMGNIDIENNTKENYATNVTFAKTGHTFLLSIINTSYNAYGNIFMFDKIHPIFEINSIHPYYPNLTGKIFYHTGYQSNDWSNPPPHNTGDYTGIRINNNLGTGWTLTNPGSGHTGHLRVAIYVPCLPSPFLSGAINGDTCFGVTNSGSFVVETKLRTNLYNTCSTYQIPNKSYTEYYLKSSLSNNYYEFFPYFLTRTLIAGNPIYYTINPIAGNLIHTGILVPYNNPTLTASSGLLIHPLGVSNTIPGTTIDNITGKITIPQIYINGIFTSLSYTGFIFDGMNLETLVSLGRASITTGAIYLYMNHLTGGTTKTGTISWIIPTKGIFTNTNIFFSTTRSGVDSQCMTPITSVVGRNYTLIGYTIGYSWTYRNDYDGIPVSGYITYSATITNTGTSPINLSSGMYAVFEVPATTRFIETYLSGTHTNKQDGLISTLYTCPMCQVSFASKDTDGLPQRLTDGQPFTINTIQNNFSGGISSMSGVWGSPHAYQTKFMAVKLANTNNILAPDESMTIGWVVQDSGTALNGTIQNGYMTILGLGYTFLSNEEINQLYNYAYLTVSSLINPSPVPAGYPITYFIHYQNLHHVSSMHELLLKTNIPAGLTIYKVLHQFSGDLAWEDITHHSSLYTGENNQLIFDAINMNNDIPLPIGSGGTIAITLMTPNTRETDYSMAFSGLGFFAFDAYDYPPVHYLNNGIIANPDLYLNKSVVSQTLSLSGGKVYTRSGDILTYTIDFGNTGAYMASGVYIVDTLSTGLCLVSGSFTGEELRDIGSPLIMGDCTQGPTTILFTGIISPAGTGNILSGMSTEISYNVLVHSSALLSTTGTNIAYIATDVMWENPNIYSNTGSTEVFFMEDICGDGIVGPEEICDEGEDNGSDSACSDSCTWNIPSCTLGVSPLNGNAPLTGTFIISGINTGWMNFDSLSFGDGYTGNVYTGALTYSHMYTTTGTFTGILIVSNIADPGSTGSCEATISVQDNSTCIPGTPDTSTVCYPNTFQRYNGCTTGTYQGTKSCGGGNGCTPGSRTPDPNTVCSTQTFTQSNGCTTRTITGSKDCTITSTGHGSAGSCIPPIGKLCSYDDEPYLENGIFYDTIGNRGFNYIETMRISCLHRGRGTKQNNRRYDADEFITRAEILKTFVKIQGLVFDDFTIQSEEKLYTGSIAYQDISSKHRFSWYANYAHIAGIASGMETQKKGKLYIQPEALATRYESIKALVITYEHITKKTISYTDYFSKLTDITAKNPYYIYVRKAETMGFVSGVPQKNGTFKFNGKENISRAAFAKIVSKAFGPRLFDSKDYDTRELYSNCIGHISPTNEGPLCSLAGSTFSRELELGYLYACDLAVTTKYPISNANATGQLIRKHFAKMISEFAIKKMGLIPNIQKPGCNGFSDIKNDSDEMKKYMILACQLGLMGLHEDGKTPKQTFDPNDPVPRTEFGTVLSRLLFGNLYNIPRDSKQPFYTKHLQVLQWYNIMHTITGPTIFQPETRGYVWMMLKRADDKGLVFDKTIIQNVQGGVDALLEHYIP